MYDHVMQMLSINTRYCILGGGTLQLQVYTCWSSQGFMGFLTI